MSDIIVNDVLKALKSKHQEVPVPSLTEKGRTKASVLLTQIKDKIPVRSSSFPHHYHRQQPPQQDGAQQRNHTLQLSIHSCPTVITDRKQLPVRSKSLPRTKISVENAGNSKIACVNTCPENLTTPTPYYSGLKKTCNSDSFHVVVPPRRSSSLRRNKSHSVSHETRNTATILSQPPAPDTLNSGSSNAAAWDMINHNNKELFSTSANLWKLEDRIFGSMEDLLLPSGANTTSSKQHNSRNGIHSSSLNIPVDVTVATATASEEEEATAESVARSLWYHHPPLSNDDDDGYSNVDSITKKDNRKSQIKVLGIPDTEIAGYLGKTDAFSHEVLLCYIDFFDLTNLRLDEAFRKLCSKLYLKAEAQEIDRILEAFSNKYFDTLDLDSQSLFSNADIVYTITYSMMLLNTDLHHMSKLSHGHTTMTCEAFVENTMDTIVEQQNQFRQQQLLSSSPSHDIPFMVQQQQQRTKEDPDYMLWKEQLENFLREIFLSIKQHGVLLPSFHNSSNGSSSSSNPPSSATTATEAAKIFIKRMGSMSRRRRVVK